ncbi:MAG: D-alanine--D-alanine ligase [Phycisphaerae bacterium]|nr:D-alanine--D-alanine ligase [Phycisphaerae bacterium]
MMRVGLTYDLRVDYLAMGYSEEETAEFDRPDTIDAIDGALKELGYRTDRIGHIRQLAARLVAGDRWDIVFNVAEGLRGVAREAQVPALLDAYEIPYTFSDPLVLALTLDKGLTKRVLRDLGVPTTDFAVVACEADVDRVRLNYPLFAKPIAEGTAKGIDAKSKIDGPPELREKCVSLLQRFRQPVLVEPYLSGREFTVGITGTGERAAAIGTLEVVLKPGAEAFGHTYHNKEHCEELVGYPRADRASADEAERIALAAWRGLNCRDGGRVDLRCDAAGRMQVLEINPLAGLHPSHSDLPILCTAVGLSYLDLIQRIMMSARERLA